MSDSSVWPALPYKEWSDTLATLHRWTQVVGKVRLERTPWINHSWHVPLYVTARGLGTSAIPAGNRVFEMDFDFVRHRLDVTVSDGSEASIPLAPRSVADFYGEVMAQLDALGLTTRINTVPSEIADGIPFEEDRQHDAYDGEAAQRFWQVLTNLQRVFQVFRAQYIGKSSPVHFFWGSFDLALTRFSGRPAPGHPAGIPALPDWVAREAYSHEVSSVGFWPGGEQFPHAMLYAYAYPTPMGFAEAPVRPDATTWSSDLGEFVLPYEAVRNSNDPEATLLDFAQDTYTAAADLGDWDRASLEWPGGARGPSR